MSDDVRNLPVWPYPLLGDDLDSVRQAKARLAVEFKVVPVAANSRTSQRVLCLREPSPWIQDKAVVVDPTNSQAVLSALRWVTDPKMNDTRASSVLDQLRAIFGEGLREVGYKELALENISKNLHIGDSSSVPSMREVHFE